MLAHVVTPKLDHTSLCKIHSCGCNGVCQAPDLTATNARAEEQDHVNTEYTVTSCQICVYACMQVCIYRRSTYVHASSHAQISLKKFMHVHTCSSQEIYTCTCRNKTMHNVIVLFLVHVLLGTKLFEFVNVYAVSIYIVYVQCMCQCTCIYVFFCYCTLWFTFIMYT